MTSSLRDALRQAGALDQFKPVGGRDAKPADTGRRAPPRREDRRSAGSKPSPSASPSDPRKANARTDNPRPGNSRPAGARTGHAPGKHPSPRQRSSEEIDLAKAYALRAQTEQRERERKEAAEREVAERRRVQREQVVALLDGNTLNRDDADIPRHFEYGGKIRRVYVDESQLAEVNDGRLGVIQLRGRYLLVARDLAESIRTVDVNAVALLIDPSDIADAGDEFSPPAA
jgi:uncharacterized protein YaiL (DUF2058 family)